jgi:tRNA(Ile)-lysidine synthase
MVAVSGGTDSTALLHVLSSLSAVRGLVLFAHGIDHGLRPEAGSELDRAEAFAAQLGVPFSRTRVKIEGSGNLQARARTVRYVALREQAAKLGDCLIATAHHADDRAETVLLRLLRGTGLRGLGVIAARDGDLLRPMLRARRSDILAHLSRHDLEFASDPSNQNPKYARVRVRHELLPLLESINPSIVEHLCAIADEAFTLRATSEIDEPKTTLGRRQRIALEQAISEKQSGFELPLDDELMLVLKRITIGRQRKRLVKESRAKSDSSA